MAMAIATVVARPVGAGNSRLTGVQNRRHTFGEACTRQGLPGRSHHAGARSCRGACIANASSGKGGDLTALVVGGGGREHALCDAIAASESAKRVICAPGNPGIEAVAECKHGVDATDKAALKHLCQEEGVDVAVVGPEEPLVKGVADGMREAGVAVVGPSSEAAELEGSKAYLKSVLQRAGVPTAEHRVHETVDGAESDVLARIQKGVVIKADGLAAGKGVFLPQCESEARESVRQAFELGNRVLVEDRLHGKEASFFALVSGDESIPLGSVQDHKRAFDNEEGPNTGGMGALSPTSALMPDQEEKVMERVVLPTARQLVREGRPFKGILFAGLMMSPDGSPYVLEHNIRLGDPEAQVLLPRLQGDLAEALRRVGEGDLAHVDLSLSERCALGVVICAGGYPGKYRKGDPIAGLPEAASMPSAKVYHSGTAKSDKGEVVTAGGRVITATGLGANLSEAKARAYEAVNAISFPDAFHRADIGWRELE